MRTGMRFRWGSRGTAMPIYSLFADAAFDSDTTALLASAFDTAWDTVKKSGSPLAADDQAASTRELLARRIIAVGRKGERDPQQLVDDALAHLTGSK
jgi:hypothetical protein